MRFAMAPLAMAPRLAAACVLAAAACAHAPPPPAPPPPLESAAPPPVATAPAPPSAPPPLPAPRVPHATWTELSNGVRLGTVAETGLAAVELRVVVSGAGHAADGERTGVAALTAELLREGARTARRLSAIGTALAVRTTFDATELSMSVPPDRAADALDLLAALVQHPELPGGELARLKRLASDRLAEAARTDASAIADMVLFKDLYALPTEQHPYAASRAAPSDVARLSMNDCSAFHRRYFVPRSTSVLVVGEVAGQDLRALAQKAFGRARGGDPPITSFTDPEPPERRKLTLVDKPGSATCEIFVGALGPQRFDPTFAAFAITGQLVAGAGARSTVTELAHGPSVVVAQAKGEAANGAAMLTALLERIGDLAARAAEPEDMDSARRALLEALVARLATPAGAADELARLAALGLADDREKLYAREVENATPALVFRVASDHLRPSRETVVVVGDAATLGPMLARFGEVKVVDPTRELARLRTLTMTK